MQVFFNIMNEKYERDTINREVNNELFMEI